MTRNGHSFTLPDQHAGIARLLETADQLALAFVLQAPWPTIDGALDDDTAIELLMELDGDHKAAQADHDAFVADLHAVSPALAARHDDLMGRLLSITQHAAVLFGLALGRRINTAPACGESGVRRG